MKAAMLLLTAGLAWAGARAEPVTYQIDPTHSFVYFEVVHFSTSSVRGRFGPVQGEVLLDREAGRGRVTLTISTATVNTGVGLLDSRMRQGDLLATEEHPNAYFVSENFRFEQGLLKQVRGEFTLRGVSRPVALTALRFNCYHNLLFRREACGGDFEAFILRSDYGASFGVPFIGDQVRLVISVEGLKQ